MALIRRSLVALLFLGTLIVLGAWNFNGQSQHTIAPAPDPQVHWEGHDVSGFYLVRPDGTQVGDSTDVIRLPEGSTLEWPARGPDPNGFAPKEDAQWR